MSESINIKNIDTNLFSGSIDPLRTNLHCYYYISPSSDGVEQIYKKTPKYDSSPDLHNVQATEIMNEGMIKYVQLNTDLATTASPQLIIPNYRIPVRIIADESKILNDENWRTILYGGVYGETSYDPLIALGTYDCYSFEYDVPYSTRESRDLNAAGNIASDYVSYDINYRYTDYYKNTQDQYQTRDELVLPNVYFDYLFKGFTSDSEDEYSQVFRDFVSHENTRDLERIHLPKEEQEVKHPLPYPARLSDTQPMSNQFYDYKKELRQFLTGAFVENSLSEATSDAMIASSNNLLYVPKEVGNAFVDIDYEQVESAIHRYPLHVNITVPVASAPTDGLDLVEIIENNDLEEEVLNYLASNYGNSTGPSGNRTNINYVREETKISPSADNTGNTESITQDTFNHAAYDIPEMFLNIANANFSSLGPNSMVVDKKSLQTSIATNTAGNYRYGRSIAGINALSEVVNKMKNLQISSNPPEHSSFIDLLMKGSEITPKEGVATIAYSIDKIRRGPTGPNPNFTKMQSMYFFNNKSLKAGGSDLKYCDTQVKYGERYTYVVYAYIAVPGIKYRYSDLRYTKTIGTVAAGAEVGSNCLEFYNSSGIPAEQLLNTETNLKSVKLEVADMTDEEREALFNAARNNKSTLERKVTIDVAAYLDALLSDSTVKVSYDQAISDAGSSAAIPGAINAAYRAWAEEQMTHIFTQDIDYEPTSGTFIKIASAAEKVTLGSYTADKNMYATNAQISSPHKYMADFYVDYQPTYKIIRRIIGTKEIAVLDHPPVTPDVTPYQRMDNSQIIGFYINKEAFRNTPQALTDNDTKIKTGAYPVSLNTDEFEVRNNYLSYNSLLSDTVLSNQSVSPLNRLQVFRIDRKPTSVSDFDGNLVHTKNLLNTSTGEDYYSNCFYEEKVQTNKKYYYMFRFVNSNNVTGHLSPIQIVELKDDGSYKYAEFDVLLQSELENETFEKDNTRTFKKVLSIKPSNRHLVFGDQDIDFESPASTQTTNLAVGNAETPIWDKTFKFRLTSKKTGKKIDLNVTYKLKDS